VGLIEGGGEVVGLGRHKFSTSTLYSDFIREIYLGGDASSEIVPRIDGIECEFERKREEERRRGRGGRSVPDFDQGWKVERWWW